MGSKVTHPIMGGEIGEGRVLQKNIHINILSILKGGPNIMKAT